MTQQATLGLIVKLFRDVGAQAEAGINTNQAPNTDLQLSGFKVRRLEHVLLEASAVDQALAFTNAAWIVLLSDSAFSVRAAAGETEMGGTDGLHLFVLAGVNERSPGVLQTSVLLTNRSGSEALVQALIIEAS